MTGRSDTLAISPDGRNVYAGTQPIAVLAAQSRDRRADAASRRGRAASRRRRAEGCADGARPRATARGQMAHLARRALALRRRTSRTQRPRDLRSRPELRPDHAEGRRRRVPRAQLGGGHVRRRTEARRSARGRRSSPDGSQVYVIGRQTACSRSRARRRPADAAELHQRRGHRRLQRRAATCTTVSFSAISPDGQTLVAANDRADYGVRRSSSATRAGNLSQAGGDACVTTDGGALVARRAPCRGGCLAHPARAGHGASRSPTTAASSSAPTTALALIELQARLLSRVPEPDGRGHAERRGGRAARVRGPQRRPAELRDHVRSRASGHARGGRAGELAGVLQPVHRVPRGRSFTLPGDGGRAAVQRGDGDAERRAAAGAAAAAAEAGHGGLGRVVPLELGEGELHDPPAGGAQSAGGLRRSRSPARASAARTRARRSSAARRAR